MEGHAQAAGQRSHSVAKVQLQLRGHAERVGDLGVHARGVRGRQLALVRLVAAARVQVAPLAQRAEARTADQSSLSRTLQGCATSW